MTEKITITINVNGQPLTEIDMGDPEHSSVYKDELRWYRREAVKPYSLSLHVFRHKDIPPPEGAAVPAGSPPAKSSESTGQQHTLEI